MGFCCYHGFDDDWVHVVHCEDHFMEVSPRFFWIDEGKTYYFCKHRTRFRREANQADNKAATVAVDSLINFEAVKVRENRLGVLFFFVFLIETFFRPVALQQ